MNPIFAQENEVMDIDQVAGFLQISSATVRNWTKHNYLMPIGSAGKTRFSARDVFAFRVDLINGRVDRLRKRANKDKSIKTFLPLEYLSDPEKARDIDTVVRLISEYNVTTEEGLFFLALNFLFQEGLVAKINGIDDILTFDKRKFFHNQIRQEIESWSKKISFKSSADFHSKILTAHIPRVQDFLGVVYQTLCSEGDKSKSGAYYTPLQIVEGITGDYIHAPDLKVLDPCCGTGQFLLVALNRLIAIGGEAVALQNVWGLDIDDTAVRIARINLIAKCKTQDGFSPNIFCKDTLLDNTSNLFSCGSCIKENFFDLVITNPPWGAKYSNTELNQLNLLFPHIQSGESFSYFIEKGIKYLKDDGTLSYILPESFLNVKIHGDIRERILCNTSVKKITYLSRAFKNVFTPVVRLDIQKRYPSETNMIDIQNGKKFKVKQGNFIDNSGFEFHINIDREDSLILEKIYSQEYYTLAGQADWALGIVTGDNAKFLSSEKLSGYEGVLTGKEISKFIHQSARNFIRFESEKFQQVAPEYKYRVQEKLIYRFISKGLVFSYDNKQLLTLNSANILIPKIEKCSIKVILGLFNSSLYQYIFQKKFSSIKVLRSHIETLPLPNWSKKTKTEMTELVDNLLNYDINENKRSQLLQQLDNFVMVRWGLTKAEIRFIIRNVNQRRG